MYQGNFLISLNLAIETPILWQYQLWSFQVRGTKLERSFAKYQPKGNYRILRIGVMASCQKWASF